MGKCIVLVGAGGPTQEKFFKNLKDEVYPDFKVITTNLVRCQLFGTSKKSNSKMEANLVNTMAYQYLAQGKDVIVNTGMLRAQERKNFISYMKDIDDAEISCIEIFDESEQSKLLARQVVEVDEGWRGVMRIR